MQASVTRRRQLSFVACMGSDNSAVFRNVLNVAAFDSELPAPVTNSMEQSPSREANISAASQEIPRPLWHLKFITALTRGCHLSLSFAKTTQSMPRSSKWSIFLRFPHRYPVCTSPFSNSCHLSSLSYFSCFDHLRSSVHKVPFYSAFSTPLLSGPCWLHISSSAPILVHPHPLFLPQCDRPSFTLMQNNKQNYIPLRHRHSGLIL
jgi:hypothetical protein